MRMPAAERDVGVRDNTAMSRSFRQGRYGLNAGCLRTGFRRTANGSVGRETETNHEQSQSYFQTLPDEDRQDTRQSEDRHLQPESGTVHKHNAIDTSTFTSRSIIS